MIGTIAFVIFGLIGLVLTFGVMLQVASIEPFGSGLKPFGMWAGGYFTGTSAVYFLELFFKRRAEKE